MSMSTGKDNALCPVDIWVLRPGAYAGVIEDRPYEWSGLFAWLVGAIVAIAGAKGYFTLTHIAAADSILVAAISRWLLGPGLLRTRGNPRTT